MTYLCKRWSHQPPVHFTSLFIYLLLCKPLAIYSQLMVAGTDGSLNEQNPCSVSRHWAKPYVWCRWQDLNLHERSSPVPKTGVSAIPPQRHIWCARWDLNPHAEAHAPQTCLSAYSSTRAYVMVPLAGLEPARYCYQRILSPLRLPIPPQRHLCRKRGADYSSAVCQGPSTRVYVISLSYIYIITKIFIKIK